MTLYSLVSIERGFGSTPLSERITARSMRFCSSRTLPGQRTRSTHPSLPAVRGQSLAHASGKYLDKMRGPRVVYPLGAPAGVEPGQEIRSDDNKDHCGTHYVTISAKITMCGCNQSDVDAMGTAAAQSLELLFLQNPQKFRLQSQGISPISSRKRVPVSAISKRPIFCVTAPVKAPFSCPNNSLSNKSKGMAAQFSFTNGRPQRALRL